MSRPDTLNPERFQFRGLHPDIHLGTASDRYGGWIGQIYSRERYEGRIVTRTRRLGGQTLKKEVLPVDSVDEYFDHFRVLEIDYTFYQPLLESGGKETKNLELLRQYAAHLQEGDFLILKAPQLVFAQKLLRKGRYEENPSYLDAGLFVRQFYEPAVEVLGNHLQGLIFEQEYQRKKERKPPDELAREMAAFFEALPRDHRYHVELRTESYLSPPVFKVLEAHGVGQVLSHWTWLPSLKQQFARSRQRVLNSGGQVVIRLMTPRGVRYEDAYQGAQPFDKMVEEMFQPEMVEETADLLHTLTGKGARVNVIVNNRSGGNAPIIASRIVEQFRKT